MTAELVVTRVLDAPRPLVFECLTTPEHLAHFWGPAGTTTSVEDITVDLRVGGVFQTVMVNDVTGERYPTRGIYTVVDPPETVAWEDPDNGMVSTATLIELDDGRTELRVHQSHMPDAFATPEAQRSFSTSIDRLAAYVAALA